MKQTIILLFLLLAFQNSYSQRTHAVLVSINQPATCVPLAFEIDDIEVVTYPNPTTHNITIQSESLVVKLLIIDPAGKTIYQSKNLGREVQVNMSQYGKGIYQCIIITQNGVKKSKIILQ